ncbi:MAG TPA: nucleoid occlusion protein [Ruminococcaceae bacterium]|nr:nucleoid occlusion protein [Oscillospiraceae bacterium]
MFGVLQKPKSVKSVIMLPVDEIAASPFQPRKEFDYHELEGLADSIKKNGILQPLSVRKKDSGYELIAGERRLRAARLVGLERVPCIEHDMDDRKSALFALLENLQRQDLSFFDEAEGLQNLIAQWGITQQEAAERLGKAQSTVANKLRLLRLTSDQRERISNAGLSERHARALLRIADERVRDDALDNIIIKGLSVADTEKMVDELFDAPEAPHKPSAPKRLPLIRDVRLFINTITRALDTMRQSGLNAIADKKETDEYIEYTVLIPKTKPGDIFQRGQKSPDKQFSRRA